MNKNGKDTIADVIQISRIKIPVRCLVTRKRACSGYKMAINRSHDIADRVNTLDVKHVTSRFSSFNVEIKLNERRIFFRRNSDKE